MLATQARRAAALRQSQVTCQSPTRWRCGLGQAKGNVGRVVAMFWVLRLLNRNLGRNFGQQSICLSRLDRSTKDLLDNCADAVAHLPTM